MTFLPSIVSYKQGEMYLDVEVSKMFTLGVKKICVFPVTRPTLIFCCDPKVFIAFEDKMP